MNAPPPLQIDFWFDFGSTYSYPASQRIQALARAAGVAVRFRPFLLGVIFKAQGWDTSPFNIYPAKGRYMWRDLARLADDLGIGLVRPDPFPQNGLLAARVASAIGDVPWHGDYCVRIFAEEFAKGRQISDPSIIADVLMDLGADAPSLLALAGTPDVKDRLRQETEEAMRLGLFGAPSFITPDGELFWGNDRLEAALAWCSQAKSAGAFTGTPSCSSSDV
jgi:2-hydroxychromene-2-carboxylate isomerase